jgi:hypothetical protein
LAVFLSHGSFCLIFTSVGTYFSVGWGSGANPSELADWQAASLGKYAEHARNASIGGRFVPNQTVAGFSFLHVLAYFSLLGMGVSFVELLSLLPCGSSLQVLFIYLF